MSWTGNYLGRDGAIQNARKKFRVSAKTGSDRIRLASVYYSAANRFFADVLGGRVWMAVPAVWFSTRAMQLASYAYATSHDGADLTLDDIDVALSIWGRYGNPLASHLMDRRRVLVKMSRQRIEAGDPCSWHTRAFLHMHNWKVYRHAPASDEIDEVAVLAERAAAVGELAQAARIYKRLARYLPRHSDARGKMLSDAKQLAAEAGATDQVKKMKAGL